MFYFVEIACVVAEVWMIHLFLTSSFSVNGTNRLQRMVSYVIFGLIVIGLSFIEGAMYIRLCFTFVGVSAIALYGFGSKLLHALLTGLTICAVVAATDVLSVLLLSVYGINAELLIQNNLTRSLYLVVEHIILFALIIIICLLNRKKDSLISIKVLLPVSPCWLVSILLCILLAWEIFTFNAFMHPLYLIVVVGLLYTNIIVIYYTNRVSIQAQEKSDAEIAEHHYAMQQEYYEQFRIQQEETRAIWHDIQKYLRAAEIDTSNALVQVQDMLDSVTCVVDVNNRVVSVILNEYFQAARSCNTALDIDVHVPQELFVTAADLYILIGNTLDNALDACSELPEDQRRISIKLKTHNSILFYSVENPYDPSHFNRIRNHYHGYGLRNVQKCVDKYQGDLNIRNENGSFTVTARLNSL